MTGRGRIAHGWRRDRRGVASMELALIASVVLVVLFAVFDFGVWVWQRMQLQAALSAATAYAQQFPTQLAGICTAVDQSLLNSFTGAAPPVAAATTRITLNGALTSDYNCAAPTSPAYSAGAGAGITMTITISYPFSPLYFATLTTTEVTDVLRIR